MKLLHTALQFEKEENAKFVMEGILKLKLKKEFPLDKNLCREIFGIEENYKVKVYELRNADLEVFIGKRFPCTGLFHVAIGMLPAEREEIIKTVRSFGLKVFEKERAGKDKLVFIAGPEGNLFELKSGN